MSESDFFGEPCKENLRIPAEVPLSLVWSVEDGILIADLDKSEVRIMTPAAELCPSPANSCRKGLFSYRMCNAVRRTRSKV
jgi:hypothetical protein